MAKISILSVTKRFSSRGAEVQALDNLSLEVADQTFVSLIGPSGCGKSTLLNIIAGFERPDSGEAKVGELEVNVPGPDRGVVFQEPALFPWLTVEENIAFGLKIKPVSHFGGNKAQAVSDIKKRVEELLSAVGLIAFRKRFPAELSGGMRQRVAIARVLALDPEVLLMDEPFGALDAMTRRVMQEFLLQIWEAKRKSVVFVTHDVDEAVFLADRVYIMTARPGRIKAVIDVGLARPRAFGMLSIPAFYQMREQALDLIHEEAVKAMEQQGERL